jgi:hypothetical protein
MTVLALGSGGYAAYLFNPSFAAVAHHEATESADIEATDAKGGKNAAKGKEAAPAAAKGAFPRRALFIAVNNYLFNNPVQQGPGNSWKGLDKLKRSFEVNLRIPSSQALQLTDAVSGSQPPTKSVIEKTVGEFTKSSRSQDCIVVWFTGHAVMAGDKACLVPIEGELDNAASLIPLETIYKDLKECKARQKVLVLDVCHYSPSVGQERPGSDRFLKRWKSKPRQLRKVCRSGCLARKTRTPSRLMKTPWVFLRQRSMMLWLSRSRPMSNVITQ